MKTIEDMVMFVPACGWGKRVASLGVKPFLEIFEGDPVHSRSWMAMNGVIGMAPKNMEVEIAVRREIGCPPLNREVTVHFMEPTTGQAATIYNWLRRARIRNYVLLSNCDNAIDIESIEEGIKLLNHNGRQGIVFTFRPIKENDARWSYVKCNSKGEIQQIKEKEPISSDAVAGVYLLNMFSLRMALHPDDVYLSEALARMQRLYAYRAKSYRGWNDLEQLEELKRGAPQAL